MYKDMLRFAWRVFRILEAAHQAQGTKAQAMPPETVSSQGGTHIMKGKKLIALVLCLLLTISLLPVSALAEGDGEEPAQPVDTTPPTAETEQEASDLRSNRDAETYTVAGTESVFGSDWDPSDANNDLTLGSNGKYSKTFTAPSQTDPCLFKVVKNHSWAEAWPSENYSIKLSGAGAFTITFDPDTKDISVSGDIVYWPDEPFEMFIAGTWNGWTTNDPATKMTRLSHNVWEKELDLTNGEKGFKFTQGSWTDAAGAENSAAYTAFGTACATGSNDILFQANSGCYKFRYDRAQGQFTVSRLCNVTVTQPAEGTLTASAASGYSGTVITLTSDPAASSYAANGAAMTGNTYTLSNEDVTFTATYASGQKYAIESVPASYAPNNQHGTVEVKNANNQTVTEAAEGEVLHFSVTPDAGYEAVKYSLYYNVYYNGATVSNCPIDQTFVMPDKKVYYSIVYLPEQSGYYWFVRNNPQPLSDTDLILSQVLSEDGDSGYYIAPTQLNSTGWLNVRYYDADTYTLGTNYQHTVTSSETGDVYVRFNPNLSGGNVTVARGINVVQPQQGGTISTLSCASAGDLVTVYDTPAAGYSLDTVTVTDANGNPVTIYGTVFTMPSTSVTVTATFVRNKFTATMLSTLNGEAGTTSNDNPGYNTNTAGEIRITSPADQYGKPKASAAGTTVSFRVTLNNAGYTYTLTAVDEGGSPVEITEVSTTTSGNKVITNYSLILPTSDVTVTAAFTGAWGVQIIPNPTWIDENNTRHQYINMTDAEKAMVYSEVSATPAIAHPGDTVTVTIAPNPGYFVKFSVMSYNTFNNTMTKVGDYTYTFVVPEDTTASIIKLSSEVYTGLDEGCYLQIDGADQANWIFMIHDNPFVDYADLVYYTKQTLSAGQELAVQYVSTPGGDPQLMKTYTVQASDLADGKATVYFHRVGEPLIALSCLNGYYISWQDQNPAHWDNNTGWTRSNSAYPFQTNDTHLFTACGEGDAYVKEEELASGKPVKVAHFVDGTVDQVWNRWDDVIVTVPYDGFTSDYDPGVVFFRPSQGIVSILRTYDLTNGSEGLCTLGAPAYCLDADDNALMKFTLTPLDPNTSIGTVTVTAEGSTAIPATKNNDFTPPAASPKTEEYVIALPTAAATVTVTTEEKTYPITVNVVGVAGNIEYSLWAFSDEYVYLVDGQTPEEAGGVLITDNVVPVGKSLGVYVTFNGAQSVYCSISYIDIDGTEHGDGGTITPEANNAGLGQTFWYMGDGPATVTLTVDPVNIVLFSQFGPYDESYLGTAPVETIIPDNPFTREGYVFTGWNTERDGSGTAYAPGQTVTLYAPLKLWAQWVKEGYFLVQIPAGAQGVSLTDTLYWLEFARNESATFGEEYMLAGGIDIPLTEGDKLFVARVLADGTVQVWDNDYNNKEGRWTDEFSLSNYTYLVDANHEDEHAKVYFREQTPNPETHPFWQDFGGHLFIAIAREIRIIPVPHGTVTASPAMGVYTETITLTVTPDPGYRLKSLEVWYRENEYDRTTITPENGVFTMPDYPVTVEAVFCLEDGFYLLGSMQSWSKDSLTPAEKFVANTNNAGEYMLEYTFTAATDAFKVVELKDGEIKDNVWYRTEMDGHTSGGPDFNYVINDQTGFKTVYFRPIWNNDWHGHIWIGDAMSPYFKGHGLALGDAINVRFNLALPGGKDLYEDSYVEFIIENATGTKRYETADAVQVKNDPDNGTPRYRYVCPVNAIQMADMITPVFHYTVGEEERTVQGTPYAAKTYIDTHKDEDEDAYRNAVRATGDYGHFAQLYLHDVHGTDYGTHAEMPLYGSGSYDYDAIYGLLADLEIVRPLVGDNMVAISYLLYCDSQTGIWLYLRLKDGYAGPTPTATYNGTTVDMSLNTADGRYRYKIAGSMASELDQMKKVTLTVGEDSTDVKVAVLSWVRGSLDSNYNGSANEKNFASSLYSYWKAAVEYQAAHPAN